MTLGAGCVILIELALVLAVDIQSAETRERIRLRRTPGQQHQTTCQRENFSDNFHFLVSNDDWCVREARARVRKFCHQAEFRHRKNCHAFVISRCAGYSDSQHVYSRLTKEANSPPLILFQRIAILEEDDHAEMLCPELNAPRELGKSRATDEAVLLDNQTPPIGTAETDCDSSDAG